MCASQSETQGLTYFEALACGLPAIVRADPCLEGVVENGINGWQWKDAAGFHQALEVLLSGTRNDSLRAGALATAERYSAGHFAAQAMQVYSEAIERRRTLNGGLPAGVPAALSGACFFLCLWLGVWAWQKGLLTDLGALQAWVAGLGVWAAVAFVAFQAIQVVIPILPGGLGCLAGVVLFGPWYGFAYNYLGICAGVHGGLRGGAVLRPPSAGADVPPQAAAEIRRLAGQKELCQMVCPGHLFPGGAG